MEARLYPIEEKYLFIMSGNSAGFCDTRLLLGHLREIRSLSTLFFRPKRLLMFVKIHLFANSREHQHFVPIEFVGGGVARTIKIIFLILIEFLVPFARLGFNYLFFLRFDIGLKGCVLIEKLVQFIVKYRSLN